jgi:hypothetical protein
MSAQPKLTEADLDRAEQERQLAVARARHVTWCNAMLAAQQTPKPPPRWFSLATIVIAVASAALLAVALSGCGGGADDADYPTKAIDPPACATNPGLCK